MRQRVRLLLWVLLAAHWSQDSHSDCELCQMADPSTLSATFEIDEVSADDWSVLYPFVRAEVGSEPRNDGAKSLLALTINEVTSPIYQGCHVYTRTKIKRYLEKVTVTWMSRAMNLSESDRCTGKDQTSVRIAQLAEGMEVFATRNESMSVEISVDGPSSVSEVCVGYEGGSCNMTGQGHSFRRCFANPSMSDGCALRMIEKHNCTVITSGMGTLNLTDHSVQLSDFDQVYVSSLRKHVEITVNNISDQSMIEVMTDERDSSKQVTLIDAGNITLHMFGINRENGKVIASGNTTLLAFFSYPGQNNRIQVNARCAKGLELVTVPRIYSGPRFRLRWTLRVGCPDTLGSYCKLTELTIGSMLKKVFVAERDAWEDDLIEVVNRGQYYLNAYAAFYTSERDECCLSDMCDFEKQCRLIPDKNDRFIWNKLCGSFVLSIYIPFVHICIATVFLITVFSVFLMVWRDENVHKSRHIKSLVLSLCYSAWFGLFWLFRLSFYSTVVDIFLDSRAEPENAGLPGYIISFVMYCSQLFIAPEMRWYQLSMIEEDYNKHADEHKFVPWITESRMIPRCQLLCCKWYGCCFPFLVILSLTVSVRAITYAVVSFSILPHIFLPCLPICAIYSGLPDFGLFCFLIGLLFVNSVFIDNDTLSWALFHDLYLFLWHFSDFLLLWSLVLQFAHGEAGVMQTRKKAAKTIGKGMFKIVKLFTKVFDLVSDYVVIVFFLLNDYILLGLSELVFVLSAAAVTVYFQWDSMPSLIGKVALMLGLGQILEIVEPEMDDDVSSFVSEMELHLESLPSLFLGMLVLLTSPREDTGPILFSMGVTWITLSLKAYKSISSLKVGTIKKLLSFLILLSDFFVRCVSPALLVSLIQGQDGDDPKLETIVFFIGYCITVTISYLCYYHFMFRSESIKLEGYLRAMISLLSCRSALFAFLKHDHYRSGSVVTLPVDLVVLIVPHSLISAVFSIITVSLLWDIYPGLTMVTLIFSLIQTASALAIAWLSLSDWINESGEIKSTTEDLTMVSSPESTVDFGASDLSLNGAKSPGSE